MPITNIDQQPFADSAKTKIARSIGATQPLFSEALITESILSELPAGYIIRPLITADFERGFIDCLAQLTDVGEMDRTRFIQTFTRMQLSGDYYVIVIEELETSKVVGCGTLLLEHKFIRSCSKASHIEDIVVDESQRGKKFGLRIIQALMELSEVLGCYKVILNCTAENVPFYEKCGLTLKDSQMVKYHKQNSFNGPAK